MKITIYFQQNKVYTHTMAQLRTWIRLFTVYVHTPQLHSHGPTTYTVDEKKFFFFFFLSDRCICRAFACMRRCIVYGIKTERVTCFSPFLPFVSIISRHTRAHTKNFFNSLCVCVLWLSPVHVLCFLLFSSHCLSEKNR